jgi:hypothetical protein
MTTKLEAPSTAQELRALEESLLQPDVRKSDRLSDLLADEFVEFAASGRTYTKPEIVEALAQESRAVQTTSDFEVKMLAPTIALLTYRIARQATPPVHTLRTSVWKRKKGQWQMIFHQATISAPPGDRA